MNETKICCEQVRDAGMNFPRYHQCTRVAKVVRKGKPYCKLHDPVAVKKKHDKRDKEQDNKYAIEAKQRIVGWHADEIIALLSELKDSNQKASELYNELTI